MQADEESYSGAAKAFKYLTSLPPGEKLNKDSLKKYQGYLLNSTGLVPNDGRYQGFKSSGKISTIENGELQNDILDLYQESISQSYIEHRYLYAAENSTVPLYF
jgi:hypothetical protein